MLPRALASAWHFFDFRLSYLDIGAVRQAFSRREPSDDPVFARLLIFPIRVYQLTLSRLLGPVCRFEPSCSRYAIVCLEHHGALRGGWLAVKRLLRCHPFHPGGFDPPPLAAPPPGKAD